MKIKLPLALLASASLLHAAPLVGTAAVHTRPDADAPVLTFLKAGSEPVPATDGGGSVPAGWMAIDLPGPFEGYVTNNDITKGLNVLPGAAIHLRPDAGSPVLATETADDKTEISGLHGKWIQVRVTRKIVGYIQADPAPSNGAPAVAAETSAAPAAPAASAAGAPGQAVAVTGDQAIPRMFEGRIVSTHRPFAPRRPYDYQLNDAAGVRFAYLDLSKLLQTEQIDKYVGRTVAVDGTAHNDADAKGIVIHVESLELK